MGRHRSNNRSILPAIPHRPGRHSRSSYRQTYSQPRPGPHQRPVRVRQRRARQHIRRDHVHHAQEARLRPHWVVVCERDVMAGFPGVFWWRWA